ncbi:uncharacterized protein LOC130758328 [Actinidia eriantha]|uniref:uncharacterized protein LOC130758328 n=1 Tax=Actinidia eriantha TaxID=165200 RepID=UPI00258D1228|nr:uncharacterized protein LOC130758328 [Actinidia eriantha]
MLVVSLYKKAFMQSPSTAQTHTWFSSEVGDYIGMESCVDLQQFEAEEAEGWCGRSGRRERRREARREREEFPPPMPSSGWRLTRYHTSDGRLVIREEKVGHHECFRAHRSNGRLTLSLVPLDDEDREDNDNADYEGDDDSGGDHCEEDDRSVEEAPVVPSSETVVSGGGKFYNYSSSSVRSNPCMLGMTLPAIRPVRI